MNEQKNIIIAVVLSAMVFMGFNYFFSKPQETETEASQTTTQQVTAPILEKRTIVDETEALQLDDRITFQNHLVKGSVNLKNGNLDDLILEQFRTETKEDSPNIRLLRPYATKDAYFIQCNCIDFNTKDMIATSWKANETSKRNEVLLTGENEKFVMERYITLDDDYLITIKDTIKNKTTDTQKIQFVASINRLGSPETSNMQILHEGMVGVLGKKLQEISYSKLTKKKHFEFDSKGGWGGITDKYWMSAFLFKPDDAVHVAFQTTPDGFQTTFAEKSVTLAANQAHHHTYTVFAGAKELKILERIRDTHQIEKFDLAVDFGWFYFLTKPIFKVLSFFNSLIGNFGIAILLVTLLSKIVLLPLAFKSYKSMGAMQSLQPKIEKIKESYAHDKIRQNQEIMRLYKTEGMNPLGGFLPMLLQIPFFFCLYKVLYINIEMRHAPFFGWIQDLSAPDPTSFFNLFGLFPWDVPSIFAIGLWPLIMGLSMYWQQRMSPAVGMDPTQQKIMTLMMPIMFTYLFASFPAGLVLYWTWNNILTVLQQMAMQTKKL